MRKLLSASALLAFVLAAAPAEAQFTNIPGLFGTGMDAFGNRLSANSDDPHYSVLGVGPAKVINDLSAGNPCRMAATWVAPPGQSCWIWQQSNGQPINTTLTFRTTFDLTGFDHTTAFLNGQWSTDNTGIDILINGVSTSQTIPGFGQLYNFSVSSGFVSGVNTLDFVVNDFGFAGGFLVGSLEGRAELANSVVPEPSTYALMAAGLASLLVVARRRRSS